MPTFSQDLDIWQLIVHASVVVKVVMAILLFGALLYPIAATPARVDDRFVGLPPTLDGEAFMAKAVYDVLPLSTTATGAALVDTSTGARTTLPTLV